MTKYLMPVLAALVTAAACAAPASAGDIQGDAYECKDLWVMRNEIYRNGGYCFKSTKAIAYFGNAGCSYDRLALVPVSQQDRSVLADIKKSERRQGC